MMEAAIAPLVGLFFAAAIYLILSRALIRVVIGIVLLGNGVNLLIFVAGRLTRAEPPIVPAGASAPAGYFANPLPQALILTAIVIGFAIFAFLVVLAFRAYQALDADNTDHMRLAEPEGDHHPPLEY
jgi:multicomponent Na+:H+ antiporter subunit C